MESARWKLMFAVGTAAVLGFGANLSAQIFDDCLANGAAIDSTLPEVVESLSVATNQVVLDVEVSVIITHTFVGDLELTLESPASTLLFLHDNLGGGADNMNLVYTDQGVASGSESFICGCAMQPQGGSFSVFSGESSQGLWTFTVDDTLGGDTGTLDNWCLSLFDVGPPPPVNNVSCTTVLGSGILDATWVNGTSYDAIDVFFNGSFFETLAGTATSWSSPPQPVPGSATVTFSGVVAGTGAAPLGCTLDFLPESTVGPDVAYTECTSITNWGQIGGVRGYSLGTHTCNLGDMTMAWGGGVTPLFGMNAYRLVDGRLEQIGMSWLKNGTVAAAGNGCGLTCNGPGGSQLGPGCRDVYGASYNGGQSRLGPRSAVNAYTGTYPGAGSTIDSSSIGERLQIAESDMGAPGALYFVEGIYVAEDDATFANAMNNASYKRVTVGGSFDLAVQGSMQVGIPALQAWQDHGAGVNQPDLSVETFTIDVASEGRFHAASKVTDLGGGEWRYDYAIYNLNSHRSGGSLTVPIPSGTTVTNVGFHDVDYHSGEPYDNTDWSSSVSASSVSWESPQTFAQNENSNALRFGTMYNFYFDCDAAPGTVSASLGLFRPGTPSSVDFDVAGPASPAVVPDFVRGDCNQDGSYSLPDAMGGLSFLFPTGTPAPLNCIDACDRNDDGVFDISDPVGILNDLFVTSTVPPAPYPGCGADGTADGNGCSSFSSCP